MSSALVDAAMTALAQFSSTTRLYALDIGESDASGLLVEAFAADDAVQGIGARDVIAVSTSAHLDLESLLGQNATLHVSLADGTRTRFAGDVSAVAMLGSEGGLARYRVRISPWLWRLGQVRSSRVWQDASVAAIIDDVFTAYRPLARWRWSDETLPFMARALPRSYCCQYRETDLDFVRRLLAEEGLNWRMEQGEDGPGAVIFADSAQLSAVPLDASAAADGGIRFHGVRVGERQDTVQALHAQRRLGASLTTVLSYDYKAKQAVAASAPSRLAAGARLPPLESYDVPGQYAYANGEQAQRYADLQMESKEARSQLWRGRSTVRTLRAGTRLTVLDAPGERLGENADFTILRVYSVGVNNLPAPAVQALAELFGPIPELLEDVLRADAQDSANAPADLALAIAQARSTGYANCFDAVASAVPWRPQFPGSDGRAHPAPTARGAQSAIVVGADGSDAPAGADEIYCDKLGRVRLRFHWQDSGAATCWVRVAQRSAGGGMGSQFLPRIGQEVLVQFIENDIDRPIIVGALYNGQGEGGVTPTPGGVADAGDSPTGIFDPAHDHAPSAHGNLAAGNSPLWHGASGDSAGHRNGAAQWGVRSKEFGGAGYNQLLFDDTDAQGRVQLKSSHAASELSLGHLIHAADNYRGSLRGQGAELRTDDWGAVRAGAGLLVTSFGVTHTPTAREPAGDNTAGIALMKQAVQVAKTFSEAAATHRTVAFAAHAGAAKANASTLDANMAPLPALLAAVSGMVDQDSLDGARKDAAAMNTTPAAGKLPYTNAPIIAVAAKGALAVSAAAGVQIAAGETVTLMSGHDTQFVSGGQLRMHSGQAIGLLGGIVKAGEGDIGVQLIAAAGAIDVQAQADTLTVQARDDVNVVSANAHIDWAAAKSISLSTSGGANITIAGGNITIQCPGKITIHAGVKSFTGPQKTNYKLPVLPVSAIVPAAGRRLKSSFAFDQLTLVAKNYTKVEFISLVAPVFGFDIPATTYIKLYDQLRAGTITQPVIKIMTGGHYPASFDNETREILVHEAAVDRAVKGNDESWELLTSLIHEFGHYIDLVLRADLSDKNPDGSATLAADAPGDEGAKFAYAIAFFDFGRTNEVEYAQCESPTFSGSLKVDYRAVSHVIRKAQGEDAQRNEGKSGSLEYFGAGLGDHHAKRPDASFGHQSIEHALRTASPRFRNEFVLRQIYFGNWLRDFSQVLDPAIVRKQGAPKDFPRAISRKKLTDLVDLFAELEFVKKPDEKKYFHVNELLLGVYRPVEHIDNPTNNNPHAPNPQTIDKDFQPLATKQDVAIDPQISMKQYIKYSTAFMRDEINRALKVGPTAEGYRHFGAALHVLEDYFAHSNYVELSLRKIGFTRVLPWTSPAPGIHRYPVVTGMFDSDDVIASTAGLIADTLFKVEWEFKATKPGERTKADRIMLILLSEHSDPRLLESYQYYLYVRDGMASIPGHQYLEGAMHYTLGMVGNAYNFVYSSLIHLVGNSVDDQQVLRMGDPNTNGSTNPTHSQLAKDHDNHPFHVLAASLAKNAVADVGRAMAARWWGNDPTKDPASVAASLIVHPADTSWQDALVTEWAGKHAQQLKRGESSTEWEALEKAHKQEAIDAINKTTKQSKDIWKYINDNYDAMFGGKNQVRK